MPTTKRPAESVLPSLSRRRSPGDTIRGPPSCVPSGPTSLRLFCVATRTLPSCLSATALTNPLELMLGAPLDGLPCQRTLEGRARQDVDQRSRRRIESQNGPLAKLDTSVVAGLPVVMTSPQTASPIRTGTCPADKPASRLLNPVDRIFARCLHPDQDVPYRRLMFRLSKDGPDATSKRTVVRRDQPERLHASTVSRESH